MKDDKKVLQDIYKNASMGRGTLERLISSVDEDEKIIDDLKGQLRGYDGFCKKSKEMLGEISEKVEKNDTLQSLSAGIGVKMNLMIDSSPSHIAEMIIEGSNMGIVDMTKTLNDNSNVEQEYKALANGLIQFEENNVQIMKKYL